LWIQEKFIDASSDSKDIVQPCLCVVHPLFASMRARALVLADFAAIWATAHPMAAGAILNWRKLQKVEG
jgi:hypothetical protein